MQTEEVKTSREERARAEMTARVAQELQSRGALDAEMQELMLALREARKRVADELDMVCGWAGGWREAEGEGGHEAGR